VSLICQQNAPALPSLWLLASRAVAVLSCGWYVDADMHSIIAFLLMMFVAFVRLFIVRPVRVRDRSHGRIAVNMRGCGHAVGMLLVVALGLCLLHTPVAAVQVHADESLLSNLASQFFQTPPPPAAAAPSASNSTAAAGSANATAASTTNSTTNASATNANSSTNTNSTAQNTTAPVNASTTSNSMAESARVARR